MATANPSVYESLGVRSFINASNNATVFGGSIMPTEVVEAMAQASTEFVELGRPARSRRPEDRRDGRRPRRPTYL